MCLSVTPEAPEDHEALKSFPLILDGNIFPCQKPHLYLLMFYVMSERLGDENIVHFSFVVTKSCHFNLQYIKRLLSLFMSAHTCKIPPVKEIIWKTAALVYLNKQWDFHCWSLSAINGLNELGRGTKSQLDLGFTPFVSTNETRSWRQSMMFQLSSSQTLSSSSSITHSTCKYSKRGIRG